MKILAWTFLIFTIFWLLVCTLFWYIAYIYDVFPQNLGEVGQYSIVFGSLIGVAVGMMGALIFRKIRKNNIEMRTCLIGLFLAMLILAGCIYVVVTVYPLNEYKMSSNIIAVSILAGTALGGTSVFSLHKVSERVTE